MHDPGIGGGRIVGEGCHFIDLLRHLSGHRIVGLQATPMGGDTAESAPGDTISFSLQFADGSMGTIHYLANGHKAFPKERLEVFCGGRVIQLDNFRRLRALGCKGFQKMNLWRQDKGHAEGVAAFLRAIRHGEPSPIPLAEIVEVTRVSFDVVTAARSGQAVRYDVAPSCSGSGQPVAEPSLSVRCA